MCNKRQLTPQSIVGFETTAILRTKSGGKSAQASLMLPSTLFTLGGALALWLPQTSMPARSWKRATPTHRLKGMPNHRKKREEDFHRAMTGRKSPLITEEQEEVSAAHDQAPHDHEDSDLDAPTTSPAIYLPPTPSNGSVTFGRR
ncbi:MAG: hypothetical protein CM15mP74_27310 [Halieaceae bacterium]|nr:MAG: hypothetical protein CM15mP74_27310 [Halieaceae bacterium]